MSWYAGETEREEMTRYFQKKRRKALWLDMRRLSIKPGVCAFFVLFWNNKKTSHVGLNPVLFENVEVIDQPSAFRKSPLRPRSNLLLHLWCSFALSMNNINIKGGVCVKKSRWVTDSNMALIPLWAFTLFLSAWEALANLFEMGMPLKCPLQPYLR